jgi:hypothetical protein
VRRSLPAVAIAALAAARLAHAAPLFEEKTANLGAPQPCAGTNEGCYSNYVVLADLDGDKDLDIVFASGGGYYAPGTKAPMAAYLNDGAGDFTEVNATAFGGFQGRLRQVTVGDIDGDGDNDVIAPDSWAMQPDAVFVNDGASPPHFTDEGAARLGTSSRAGAVRLADVDSDGDLDLVVSDWGASPPTSAGTAKLYLNDGAGHFSELAGAVPQNTQAIGTGPIDMDLFDADGDFDLDLLIASREGESLLFVNDGTGHFGDANARLPDQPGPYVYGPDACDVDGDGDLDVWLDNGQSNLREQLVLNDGTGTFMDVTDARVTGDPQADDNQVRCVDVDGDGDMDAIVASLSDVERVLENDGTAHFTTVEDAFPAVSDSTLGLDVGDLNGDGRLDVVTAQGESGGFLNRLYFGLAGDYVDMATPRYRAVEQIPDGAYTGDVVVHFAVVDAATSDVGPRLDDAWLAIEGGNLLPARFMGGDLYRAVIPNVALGQTITYRACARDRRGNQSCSGSLFFRSAMPVDDAGPGSDAGTGGGGGDGCGCRAGGRASGAAAWLAGASVALAIAARLRRRRRL